MKKCFLKSYDALDALFDFAGQFGVTYGLSERLRFELNVVIEELFTNAVKFAPPGPGEVEFDLQMDAGVLTLLMVDTNAREFDVEVSSGHHQEALQERAIGGLGLQFIHQIMDSVDYRYHHPISRIVLTKRVD